MNTHCLAFLAGVALTWCALTAVYRTEPRVASSLLLSRATPQPTPRPTPSQAWMWSQSRRTPLDAPARSVKQYLTSSRIST